MSSMLPLLILPLFFQLLLLHLESNRFGKNRKMKSDYMSAVKKKWGKELQFKKVDLRFQRA